MIRRVSIVLLTGFALATFSACTPTVAESDLEKTVSDKLEAQVGQKPDKIDCPGDLKGKKGEKMKCTLTAGGDKLGVTVTVTSVKGRNVGFDIAVDQ